MFVTYKIINLVTQQYYIGSHKTDKINDDYMGSGKRIKASILQYGICNHKKEILGIFENRKDSIDLEHTLIKEAKENGDDKILNKTNGGFSFDYINENLSFDRAAFARMASHEFQTKMKEKNMEEYYKNPIRCKQCGQIISYKSKKEGNVFCSKSCSATFNNLHRKRRPKETRRCKFCGKEISNNRNFCSRQCFGKYVRKSNIPTIKDLAERERYSCKAPKKEILIKDKEIIVERHKTESLRQIAKDYNVSANYLKDFLKNRL